MNFRPCLSISVPPPRGSFSKQTGDGVEALVKPVIKLMTFCARPQVLALYFEFFFPGTEMSTFSHQANVIVGLVFLPFFSLYGSFQLLTHIPFHSLSLFPTCLSQINPWGVDLLCSPFNVFNFSKKKKLHQK